MLEGIEVLDVVSCSNIGFIAFGNVGIAAIAILALCFADMIFDIDTKFLFGMTFGVTMFLMILYSLMAY